jgi:hypothetical protein
MIVLCTQDQYIAYPALVTDERGSMMTALDGYQVYDFFRAGSRRVNASRKHLDDINVFPVPDGDTGTNLSSTLAGTVEATVPGSSASSTLGLLADAALISAVETPGSSLPSSCPV